MLKQLKTIFSWEKCLRAAWSKTPPRTRSRRYSTGPSPRRTQQRQNQICRPPTVSGLANQLIRTSVRLNLNIWKFRLKIRKSRTRLRTFWTQVGSPSKMRLRLISQKGVPCRNLLDIRFRSVFSVNCKRNSLQKISIFYNCTRSRKRLGVLIWSSLARLTGPNTKIFIENLFLGNKMQ